MIFRDFMMFNTGGDPVVEEAGVESALERGVEGVIFATMYYRALQIPKNALRWIDRQWYVLPLEIVAAIADAKECFQLICSALNVALSIRPVTGILATDWNQRIAICVSGPIVPSTGP